MTTNFPDGPLAVGQTFTQGDLSWLYDGAKWVTVTSTPLPLEVPLLEIHGGTGVYSLDDAPLLAAGSTTHRTLGARAADVINVMDFGAVMDGVVVDTAAFSAALSLVPARGTIFVPPGGINLTGFTGSTANKPVLWRLSGNDFTTGSTGVTSIGNGLVETFLQNTTKFFGRGSSSVAGGTMVPALGSVLRADMTLDHDAGPTGGLTAIQANVFVAPDYTGNASPIGLGISVSDQRTVAGSGAPLVGFIASALRLHSGAQAIIFGGNPIADDRTGVNSTQSGSAVGMEINVKANKLDDGTTADGFNVNSTPSGSHAGANRVLLDLKYLRSDPSDLTPTSFSNLLRLAPSQTEPDISAKNFIALVGVATFTGINMLQLDTTGGQALALKTGQTIAWTTAASNVTPTSWNYLQYATSGGNRLRYVVGSTELLSLSDAGRMSFGVLPTNAASDAAASAAGVPIGGVYRNGSVLQIRVA